MTHPNLAATARRDEAPGVHVSSVDTHASDTHASDNPGAARLGELLSQLLEPIVRLTGARGAAVRALVADRHFGYIASLGMPPRACGPGHTMDRHCGTCGTAIDTGAVVWARDLSACRADVQQALGAGGHERILVVPLRHRGRLLGVYNLFFDAQQAEPSSNAKAMLRAMGELLGMALNNAQVEADEHRHQLALERQRMAAEVHDSVAQSVAFMKMRLALLDDALAAGDTTRAQGYCRELRGVASDAHTSLRIVLTHFRDTSDAMPVAQVLASRLEQWRRDSDIDFVLDNQCPALDLSPARANEVVHVVQEAVTNVIRHARATQAQVRLRALGDGRVEAVVEDNGTGLAPAVLHAAQPDATEGAHDGADYGTHYGLAIMRERAHRLHGTLELGTRDDGRAGTRVRLVFPERAGHALDATVTSSHAEGTTKEAA